MLVVPFTLLIILVLIYMNTKSMARTAIVLLAVPFLLVGAFWLLYLLDYNLSVAVWVGLIALAGLDAETGVVMLLYLDHAWDKFQAAGRLRSEADLHAAVLEGAVQRIRPKIMTVCAILFGLLPIMWSPTTQVGADVMKRIAAPMIGGVVTSAVLELLLYPAIYVIWRRRHLSVPDGAETRGRHDDPQASRGARRRWVLPLVAVMLVVAAAGGYRAWHHPSTALGAAQAPAGKPFAVQSANGMTVSFILPKGELRMVENTLVIEFREASSGQLVDVGTVKFALDMNMPGMVMHSGSTVTPGDVPGRYTAKVTPDMGGEWVAQLHYEGPRGSGAVNFRVQVEP